MTEQFRPRGFSLLPPVVKNLLIINGLMFLAQIVAEKAFQVKLQDSLGLHYPGSMDFRPWQFITYMFLHGSFMHIFFNMFALWMFGYALENIWGPKRFLIYYFVTGIGAAVIHYIVLYVTDIRPFITAIESVRSDPTYEGILRYINQVPIQFDQNSDSGKEVYNLYLSFRDALEKLTNDPENKQALIISKNFFTAYREYYLNLPNVIGASGAVFGILLAFGMLFPNTLLIFVFFPFFPIKAKYFVIFYGLAELWLGISGAQSNIAHFAHLGGMVFGFFLILYWKKKGRLY
jgi:membrane associated rhomboid family serine protease